MFPELGPWLTIKDGDPRAYALFSHHYSFHQYRDNRRQRDRRIVGPGEALVLMTLANDALFVWKKFDNPANEQGIYCSIFRNESHYLSSFLILEAEKLALAKWPLTSRFYTYIDSKKVKPTRCRKGDYWGFCYLKAGWRQCDYVTKVNQKLVFEKVAA
jgi:hypothetical protein